MLWGMASALPPSFCSAPLTNNRDAGRKAGGRAKAPPHVNQIRRNAKTAFNPPNANEFDSAYSISARRGQFGM
jgi:hypothetical protein